VACTVSALRTQRAGPLRPSPNDTTWRAAEYLIAVELGRQRRRFRSLDPSQRERSFAQDVSELASQYSLRWPAHSSRQCQNAFLNPATLMALRTAAARSRPYAMQPARGGRIGSGDHVKTGYAFRTELESVFEGIPVVRLDRDNAARSVIVDA
jgi:hypothetical protein